MGTSLQNSGQRGYESHISFAARYDYGGAIPMPEVIVTATVTATFRLVR